MLIAHLLAAERIIPELAGTDKPDVLSELSRVLASGLPGVPEESVFDILMERERLSSTGIGNAIAIPHGKLAGLKTPVAALGRSLAGVDFQAMDAKPVHLIFALLSPVDAAREHLRALAAISRFLRKPGVVDRLMAAESGEAMYGVVRLDIP